MATSSTEPTPSGESPVADGENASTPAPSGYAVGESVTVFAGTDREAAGTIVEDFGEFTPVATEYDGERIAGPARRWAVLSDAGDLVFADTDDLSAGGADPA